MISVSDNQVIYLGDGQTTSFGYNFKILNRSDLHLLRVDKNGNETEVTSDFYIHMDTSIVDYPGYAPGAEEPEVDRPLVLARGEKLVIYREVPITQESQMPTQWPFDVNEDMHDKSCIIDQQLKGDVDRALKVKRSIPINDFNMEFPVPGDDKGYGLRVTNSGFSLTADPGVVYEETKDYAATAEAAANECEEWADHIVYVGEEQPTFEKTYVWVDTDEDDEYQSSIEAQIAAKQDKLIAGQNITIAADGKTISATASVDAYTKAETDTLLGAKANTSTTYTKDEVDGQFTTVSGDITQLYGDIANRVEKNQGAENSGKYLKVGESGTVAPTELSLKTINNESILGSGNIAISGSEEDMTLLEDITIEETVKEVMLPLQANHSKTFKNISIQVTIPKGNSFSNAFCLFLINNADYYGRTGFFTQHATYSTILANYSSVKNGKIFSLSASAANAASNSGTFVFSPAGLCIYKLKEIKTVKLVSFSNIFVEGTVIKVWGV